MDKVKKFLEAYVQWLALALGVAFLGWTVYGYIITKPVSSTVGGTPGVEPAAVDPMVDTEIAGPLSDQLGPNSHAAPIPHPATDVAAGGDPPVPPSVAVALASPWTPISPSEDVSGPDNEGAKQNNLKITKLPEPAPPVTNLVISKGHSNVPAPVAPAASGAAAPQAGANAPAVDKIWRTVAGTFPTAELAKMFKAVGIQPGTPISNIDILHVKLTREERMVDGSWGPETEIAPLEINPLLPLPDINAPYDAQVDYQTNFAEKNFTAIARPPFYQVLQGDAWYEPGTPDPKEAQTVADEGFDPLHPGDYTGDPNKLLPSEKAAYNKAKQDQAARDQLRNRNQNNRTPFRPIPGGPPPSYFPGGPGGGGPGGGPGGRGSGAVNDLQRDAGEIANPYPGPLGFGPGGMFPPGYRPGAPGGPGGMYPPPPVQPGAQPGTPAENVPTASFDPSQQPEFKIWAHDATVQAGKTYRYRLQYVISNPVARTTGLCPPALAQQFYIASDPSAWTDPVSVESDTNFYAIGLKHGVEFNIFKWKDGVWQMQDFTAGIGDMVGSVVTDPTTGLKTDFTTGWTLVDIREDSTNNENRTILLVSDNGTALVKELIADEHSSEYRKLYFQANQNKTAMGGN